MYEPKRKTTTTNKKPQQKQKTKQKQTQNYFYKYTTILAQKTENIRKIMKQNNGVTGVQINRNWGAS